MRIFIGDPHTKKFLKLVDIAVIDASTEYDNVVYVYDSLGHFMCLTFPSRENLQATLSELRSTGCGTAYAIIEYPYQTQEPEDYDREIDPNTIDDWGLGYEYR